MSGFRRHIMAKLARQYIEGYCIQHNVTISLQINGIVHSVTADNDGYWNLNVRGIDIVSLNSFADSNSLIANVEFHCNTNNVSNISYAFRNCDNLTQIKGLKLTNNLTNCNYAFGKSGTSVATRLTSIENLSDFDFANCENMRAAFLNYGGDIDMTLWSVEKITTFNSSFARAAGNISGTANHKFYSTEDMYGMFLYLAQESLRLDNMECPNATTYQRMFEGAQCTEIYAPNLAINAGATTTDMFRQCSNLTNLRLGNISETLSIIYSPLNLASAILILQHLQDVTSYGGKTLTFSSTTSALVQADTTAMNLVAQAQANGWTIAFN